MKKITMAVAILIFGSILFFVWAERKTPAAKKTNRGTEAASTENKLAENSNLEPIEVPGSFNFQPPLSRASERVTKKPFGLFITPQNSPVSPEKFRGFHTGTDFEIFSEELELEVPVKAVCSGKLLAKKSATGYGGVAVQACDLEGQPMTVVYGHLKLESIVAENGNNLKAGDRLGILGAAHSSQTSGERKHLHLGLHKGTTLNIFGYVQNENQLAGWIDPCPLVCYDSKTNDN